MKSPAKGVGKSLKAGERVFCKVQARHEQCAANIVNIKDDYLEIKQVEGSSVKFLKGQNIVLQSDENDYFAEVVSIEGDTVLLKCLGKENRGFFRVDDVMPVIVKKVIGNIITKRAKLISEYGVELLHPRSFYMDVPDGNVSPVVWKMLVDINTKLGLVLDRLTLGHEGLINADETRVNLSASGIRLDVKENYEVNDYVEVKMLLPTSPPMGIVVYGIVMRSEELPGGMYGVSINFSDMEDVVRDEIIQYSLRREREILRKQRQSRL
ncbi:MAG: PilZ domain-containing protein [Nitrospirae bacterium]|nr:PilZ domain-containing protein [Nitrospirota bacterium]